MTTQRSLHVPDGIIQGVTPLTLRGGRAQAAPVGRLMAAGRKNSVAIWLSLIGLIIPAADAMLYIGGAKFTAGKLCVALLLVPALVAFCARSGKLVLSDALACATAVWIVVAASQADGSKTMSSALSESLEFFGSYVIARAFIFGPAALHEFAKVLKILAIVALLFAIVENISGRLIVHEIVASLFGTTPPDAQYRNGMVRATATFDHAILYGAFCCFTGTILLYAESDALKRTAFVGLCCLGCILSWSSSALLSLTVVMAVYCYDRVMQRFPWRWSLFWAVALLPILSMAAASENPIGWFLSHLTLEPESGYFRLMIWHAAYERLSESPWIGYGFNLLDSDILDATVDSVWLVMSLRFGLPMVVLLLLSILATFLPVGGKARGVDVTMDRFATAFTMVLATFIFIGITVHFWNYIWIFLGLCIGVRASLREWSIKEAALQRRALSLARAAFAGR
jgi:hypothetical protein